jgi:alkylation response protein AidB-like acyl-CoA dehydrogenase
MSDLSPFEYTDEHDDLRRAVRKLAAEHASPLGPPGYGAGFDKAAWAALTGQLGLTAILVPARYGGMDGTWIDLAITLEEAGAVLLRAPYLSTVVLGTATLLASGDDAACERYLPRIAEGELLATVATRAADAAANPLRPCAKATRNGGSWELNAPNLVAIEGMTADVVFVVADHDYTCSVFAVHADAAGFVRTPLTCLDLTRPQTRIDLSSTPAELIGEPGAGLAVLRTVLDLGAVAHAAEQVGATSHCLRQAVDYTKQRIQFGRPIASFQAVKHTCADLLVELEFGRSAAAYAAWAAAEAPAQLPRAAAEARLWCSDMFARTAEECLQLYGGLGATWEHHSHLYLRRAKSSRLLLSGSGYHRRVLAAHIEKDSRDRVA